MPSLDDDPLAPLRRVTPEVPRDVDARVLARGEARFARGRFDFASDAAAFFERAGIPVALAGTAVIYLAWAVETASALYR